MTTSNTNALKETRTLRLDNPVVVRKVPMTAKGCDMLRAIRGYQSDQLSAKHGLNVEIPFPTSFQLMMSDYCELRGIKVTSDEQSKE